jgi:GNAT superfamily N-acetyltransferase
MTAGTVEVHELRPELVDAVRSLILAGLGEHWGDVDPTLNRDLDDLAATYAAGSVLVASDGEHVVGTGTVVPRGQRSAEIVRMSVSPAYRGVGLGRRLVGELVERARGWGMERVVLETSAQWTDVVEFYLRCGFTQTHFEDGEFGPDAWFEMRLGDQVETGDDATS